MAYQIKGRIEQIGAITSIPSKDGSKTFYKREFVLDCTRFDQNTGEPWENHPKLEFSGEKCQLLNSFQVGQRVEVDFNLNGAKYVDKQTGETKYFTSIKAFKVSLAEQPANYIAPGQQVAPAQYMQPQQYQQPLFQQNVGPEPLPF